MDTLKEIATNIVSLIGLFVFLWFGAYCIEKGKQKATKSLRVCDMCFRKIKHFVDVNKQ